jgi:hypothetical protein
MKRTVKYALSVAMTAAFVAPAFAQDTSFTPFPDNKEGHWAYDALNRMKKEGILVGYPNGMYLGSRLATRYEMAVAINAAYNNLRTITDGLGKQLSDLSDKVNNMHEGVSPADLQALKDQIKDLQDQVASTKSYGDDIRDLRAMADKFGKDLAALGVDVDDMKKNLDGLAKRVTALENNKLPVMIHGDVNFFGAGGYSTSHNFGLTVDGRPTGVARGALAPGGVGADKDVTFMHEAAFDISGTNEHGPKWHVVAVVGNMLGDGGFGGSGNSGVGGGAGAPFGTQSTLMTGRNFGEGVESVYIQTASASFMAGMDGMPFSLTAGRFGLKLGDYILERPDYTPYYKNNRWDNGEYDVDGLKLGFKFGGVKLDIFGARTSDQTDSLGVQVQPMFAGPGGPTVFGSSVGGGQVDELAGVHAWVPLGSNGSVDLSYLMLASAVTGFATVAGVGNEIMDWGGDLHWKFNDKFNLRAGYSRTDVYYNSHSLLSKDDQRLTGMLGYHGDKWGLSAGYDYIEPYFGAPGYWGRIGTWWNPVDIEGFDIKGHLTLSDALSLHAGYRYVTGTGRVPGGLTTHDKITALTAELKYKFGSASTLTLGYENDMYNNAGGTASPYEAWYNIGYDYAVSHDSMFSVLWQISDYNGKSQAGFTLPWGGTRAQGGLITTQFSVKF